MTFLWKKKESDVKWHQIISEIHGFEKKYGSFPTHFIISADSEAEDTPMDYSSNFGEEINSIVEDLKDSYPDITFQLVDTRYFELNKKYNYFKSYKQKTQPLQMLIKTPQSYTDPTEEQQDRCSPDYYNQYL